MKIRHIVATGVFTTVLAIGIVLTPPSGSAETTNIPSVVEQPTAEDFVNRGIAKMAKGDQVGANEDSAQFNKLRGL
jgi:hypothetical protein